MKIPKGVAKYHNRKVEYGDLKFDSIKEFERWQVLRLLEEQGKIENLQLQPKYELRCHGEPIKIRSKGYPNGRKCSYRADFRYWIDGEMIIEDVKGFDTEASRLRRAVVEAEYGFQIIVV